MRRQKQESNIVQKCNIPVKPQRTLRPIHLVIVGLFCFALGLSLVLLISFALREDAPPATNTPDVTTAVTTAATTTAPITPETPSDVATPVSQGLVFTSNGDGTCSVSGIGTCTDVEILIPESSPVGETVTGIAAGAFDGCAMISSVRIPATVADIDAGAFCPAARFCRFWWMMKIRITNRSAGISTPRTEKTCSVMRSARPRCILKFPQPS